MTDFRSLKVSVILLTCLSLGLGGCASRDSATVEAPSAPVIQPEWHALAIGLFKLRDQAFPPPQNAVLFIGSSSFTLWNETIDQDLTLTVIPRGFGGSKMEDVLFYYEDLVVAYSPRAIVLYEGDNDIAVFNKTPDQVLREIERFAASVQNDLPGTRIYILSIKPSPSRMEYWPDQKRANELIEAFAGDTERVSFVDVASAMFDQEGQLRAELFIEDGVHMNPLGYDIWQWILNDEVVSKEMPFEASSASLAASQEGRN